MAATLTPDPTLAALRARLAGDPAERPEWDDVACPRCQADGACPQWCIDADASSRAKAARRTLVRADRLRYADRILVGGEILVVEQVGPSIYQPDAVCVEFLGGPRMPLVGARTMFARATS